jgi:PAS domain S-box-containing protein
MLRRPASEALEGRPLSDLAPSPELVEGLREFVRVGYRLDAREQLNIFSDGSTAWTRASLIGLVEGGCLRVVWLSQGDITAQKRAEEDLRARSRILEAVAFCSARFLASGGWADHAAEALARLGEAAGVGCAYIFENREVDGALFSSLTHEWTTPGAPPLARDPLFTNFRWPPPGPIRSQLSAGTPLVAAAKDLSAAGQQLLGRVGMRSVLIVPVIVEGRWWGLLGFGDFRQERRWSTAEVEALRTGAASLAAAVFQEGAGAALRASEKKYKDIFSYSPVGIYQSRPDGTLITANDALARLLGYGKGEEVLGLGLAQDVYADPEERSRLIAKYEAVGRGSNVEVELKRRDGTRFWSEMSSHAIKDADGSTLYFETFVHDITARKAAERGLRESEERYRLLFEGNPLPMLVYDPATLALLGANAAGARQFGYSLEELLAMSIADLAPPEDPDIERLRAASGEARPDVLHVGLRRQLRKDGGVVESDLTSLTVTFAGRPARLVLLRDVTAERKAAVEQERLRQALETEAAEWQRTVDAVDTAILILDPELRTTRMNRAARDLLGGEYLAGPERTKEELFNAEPWRTGIALTERARLTGTSTSAQAKDPSGERSWEVTAYVSPQSAGQEERIILVIRDITPLVILQESLRHSETMAALGLVVAGVAHEVRNPLFAIIATLDAFEAAGGERSKDAEYLTALRTSVARLNQLTRDLLEYGRPRQLNKTAVTASDLVRRAIRACASLARERGVDLVEAVAPACPALEVDSGPMEQVLQNLIANAVQHSGRGGRVRIVAGVSEGTVEFRVEDDGPGIDAADLPRLFEPFFSRRKGGTGLGLSIVERMVEAHGGRVKAENRSGRGAAFTVRLPLVAPRAG